LLILVKLVDHAAKGSSCQASADLLIRLIHLLQQAGTLINQTV
jgi:hypothetical protein